MQLCCITPIINIWIGTVWTSMLSRWVSLRVVGFKSFAMVDNLTTNRKFFGPTSIGRKSNKSAFALCQMPQF